MTTPNDRPLIPASLPIPTDWTLSPVVRQCREVPYSVLSNKSQCLWTMGVAANPSQKSPTLEWFDWRVFIAVHAILLRNDSGDADASFREIAAMMGSATCGKSLAMIRDALFRLRDFWVHMQRPDGSGLKFPLVEFWIATQMTSAGEREALTKIRMHRDFVDLVTNESAPIRYDELRRIRSAITATLYLFLPARVWHWKGRASARVVGFGALAEALGLQHQASRMRKLLTQNAATTPGCKNGSVVQQLDGMLLRSGIMRCEMAEDGLRLWWEIRIPTTGCLHDAFLRGGGDEATWSNLFSSRAQMMTEAQWADVRKLGVTDHFQSALHSCAKVLNAFSPAAFAGVISLAAKTFPKAEIRNPGKALYTMLVDVVEAAPKRKNFSGTWWEKPALARRDKKSRETMARRKATK